MKHCVTTKILTKGPKGEQIPFEETIRFLKQAGFEEIDMELEPPVLLAGDWEDQLNSRLRCCEHESIRIRYAHLPFHYPSAGNGLTWEDFYVATCRAIDFAKEAGADCAAIHPRSFMTADYNRDKEFAAALEFLTPYQNYALQKGLVLALENMRGPGQHADPSLKRLGTEVSDVIALADALQMGICWDTGHGNISGQHQFNALTAIGRRLRMVHLNDNYAEDDIHLAISLGSIHWDQVAAGLAAADYQGSLNTEVSCNRIPEMLRLSYVQYMADSVRWLDEMIRNTVMI